MKSPLELTRIFFETALLFFVFSFFLTLGADYKDQVVFRQMYAGILFVFFLIFFRPKTKNFSSYFNFSILFFSPFLGFEIARYFYFKPPAASVATPPVEVSKYLQAPVRWIVCFGTFLLFYFYFSKKAFLFRLLNLFILGGFFVALNIIPPLLMHRYQKFGYALPEGGALLFHPVFHFHPWVQKYLMAMWSHPNWIGDVMIFGFFPAFALAFYGFFLFKDKLTTEASSSDALSSGPLILLYLTIAFVIAAGVLLVFSRGTIVFFLLSLFFYLGAIALKFPSRYPVIFILAVMLFAGGFLVWAGNLNKAWKEVQTLQKETDSTSEMTSFSVNKEGAQRALRIYKQYSVWGVGTKGYKEFSLKYADPKKTGENYQLARFEALSHYLHLLAEEGIGAYFYFLFLIAYVIEMGIGLFKTNSRFKFMIGLAFLAAVLAILGHAAINDLMQRFSMSMLVYMFMGTSLALFRPDFEHR